MLIRVLWIILFALGLTVALLGLYTLVLIISGLFVNKTKLYTRDSKFYRLLLDSGMWLGVNGARLHITAEGLDKIPSDGRFLLVSNHRSKFDPIVTWYVLHDSNIAFISKPENFHIPFYGRIIRRCCCLPIDREDPRKALETISASAELLKNDAVSIGVYPEGTRSKTGALLPFHNGVFKIAKQAGVPIVVLTVDGTEMIHQNYPLTHTDITLKVAETIPVEDVLSMRTGEIGDRVYKDFVSNLNPDISSDTIGAATI